MIGIALVANVLEMWVTDTGLSGVHGNGELELGDMEQNDIGFVIEWLSRYCSDIV